ncbi:MAG: colicin V production protein [Spirochaetae bacterium HGW-Spirochaetae-9]|nr:MAG: colicin V production protein [Spirochaetae bacterium HGW-Spirochaetae-9]
MRGFAMEFSSRAGFLVGFVVALVFARLGASLVSDTFDLPILWSTLIAFIVFFIIGYVLMMMVGSLLDRTLDAMGLDWLDRLLGMVLGVVEVVVVVAFIVYLLELQNVVNLDAYLDPSVITSRFIRPLTPKGLELVKGLI